MFKKAVAVWADGREKERNLHLIFTGKTASLDGAIIRLTASVFYKLFVNGKFVSFGPARTAKGYARVDEIDISSFAVQGENEVRIEVAGYYCKCLSTELYHSFLTAEVLVDGEPILYTGKDFTARENGERAQKVERYSFQRHFGEVIFANRKGDSVLVSPVKSPIYIERRVPYPNYPLILADGISKYGSFAFDENLPYKEKKYSEPITIGWGRYEDSEIESFPFRWAQRQALNNIGENLGFSQKTFEQGEYAVIDFKRIEVGFFKWDFELENADIVIGFTEMPTENNFEFQNANMHNVIEIFGNGKTDGESFEPYSSRVVCLFVKSGKLKINAFGVRGFERGNTGLVQRKFKNKELEKIYTAGVRTFNHNAVDIYTDCPSRERAGWLCDSYFTAKAESFLYGENPVEDAFLENFVLYNNEGDYPKGVLPMCFPADAQEDKKFIPQWCMWYILEIGDYLFNRKPAFDKEFFKKTVFEFVEFLSQYENEDGMLEKLPSWNFIEWSTANQWTQDVNYPTNFLYAEVLDTVYKIYGTHGFDKRAEKLRQITVEKSFDGKYFVDHAVRDKNGVLVNKTDTSEAGQYYAMLFGGINIFDPKYAYILQGICTQYEVNDREFVPVNAFIGFYLKQASLLKYEELYTPLKNAVLDFFAPMIATTETFWEYKQNYGSRDHGFASYATIPLTVIDGIDG